MSPALARRALPVSAALTVVVLAVQFVTAGPLVSPAGGNLSLHQASAIVLHVVSGLTALAAVLHQRATDGPWWPSALAAVVFAATFVQAATGGFDTLWAHVPGAMVLTVGAVWVAAWSVLNPTRQGVAART